MTTWLILIASVIVGPPADLIAFEDEPADAAFFGGKIITGDAQGRVVEALAVKYGRVLAVGTNAEIDGLLSIDTRVTPLHGKTVLPGFIETHCHAIGVGQAALGERYEELSSIAEIQGWLRKQAAQTPKGRWLVVPRNEITRLKERRFPTPDELDAGCTTHPVLYTSVLKHVLNSTGFKALGVVDESSTIAGAEIVRVAGRPVLMKGGDELLRKLIPRPEYSPEQTLGALANVIARYNEVGITSIFERATDAAGYKMFQELRRRDRLTARVTTTFRFSARDAAGVERYLDGLALKSGEGDEWVKTGPLKITVDGGIHWGTTRLSEPYGPKRAAFYRLTDPAYRGELFCTTEQMKAIFAAGTRRGWQMSAHVTGDEGVERVLDAVEAVAAVEPSITRRRFTLIHAYFPSPAIVARAKRLGVCVDTQGYLYYRDADALADVYGPAWAERFIGLGDWARGGVPVALNSDHMIGLDPDHAMNAFNPLLMLTIAVSRKTEAGIIHGSRQKLSRLDALRAVTLWAAHLSFDEAKTGSLEPGKFADLVILDGDYLACSEDKIRELKVQKTIVGGKVVFERR